MTDVAMAVIEVIGPPLRQLAAQAKQATIRLALIIDEARPQPGQPGIEGGPEGDHAIRVAGEGRVDRKAIRQIAEESLAAVGIATIADLEDLPSLGRKEGVVEVDGDGGNGV